MAPLTKHLYREDEVAAALMFCVVRGRSEEAAFWCLELLESALLDRLFASLRTIWLLAFCTSAPQWLVAFEAAVAGETIEEDVLLELVTSLSILAKRGGREGGALQALLGSPAVKQEAMIILEVSLEEALRAAEEGGGGPGFAAVATACIAAKDPAEFLRKWKAELPKMPETIRASIQGWKDIGRANRKRRVFAVPVDCLYWITERGREQTVYDTNEKDIMRSLEKPKGIWGSEYWDEVAEAHGGWEAIRNDDAAREAFYDAEFPDDIPDEWSKEERAKSHGSGVLQKAGTATAADWIRRWFVIIGLCTPAQVEGLKRRWLATGADASPQSLQDLWS